MSKKWTLWVCLTLTVCLLGGCAYLPMAGLTNMLGQEKPVVSEDGETVTISKADYERYKQFDTLLDLMDMSETYFYQEADPSAMLQGAAAGLLAGLNDPYTFYYTPEAYAEMWEDDEGEYAGVRIQISSSYLTGICTISRVFKGGPAEAAGVHRGDILYKVGDLYVDAYSVNDAVDIMRGTPGTDVDVTFLRDGEEITFTMTRAQVHVTRVDSTMLAEDIGYIYLYDFAGDCAVRFTEALESLTAQGAKGIIIDLRDNPGGWVNDAETIGDLFLDEGVLYYLEYKDGAREYTYTKAGKADVKLVVLMNENSASSSEILAGALQDRADATVVGVQSFGKGIVQIVVPVGEDGSGMQMTVAQYYTPNGNAVHKIGITPDETIALAEDDNGMYQFGDLSDPQLARALEVMKQKMQ